MGSTDEGHHDPSGLIDLFLRKSRRRADRGRRETSITAQETRGRAVAAELGLTVRHVWREVGSASRFSTRKARQVQDAALRALERRETGALWLFRVDRWDRRGAGAILRIIEPDDGIPRRLLVDNGDPDNPGIALDSANPRDREELIRQAELARRETEILSERIRTTKQHQLKNGEWVNGRAPYGYRVILIESASSDEFDDEDVVIERRLERDTAPAGDPTNPNLSRADIARWVRYGGPVSGHKERTMVQDLNRRNVPGPLGKPWSIPTVRDMLANPVYCGWQSTATASHGRGRVIYRNEAGEKLRVVVGEPILTDAEDQEAKSKLRVPGSSPHMARDTRAKHLLTGRLRCHGCGSAATHRGPGYQCWRPSAGQPCPAPAFAAQWAIEGYVVQRWISRLSASEPTDELVMTVAERWAAVVQPSEAADARAALNALEAAELALARVWADRRAGLYSGPSEAFFPPALREANEAVDAARLAVRETAGARGVDVTFLMDSALAEEAWNAADLPMRRTLLGLAIDVVEISRSPYRGARFVGPQRVRITWADGVTDPAPPGWDAPRSW